QAGKVGRLLEAWPMERAKGSNRRESADADDLDQRGQVHGVHRRQEATPGGRWHRLASSWRRRLYEAVRALSQHSGEGAGLTRLMANRTGFPGVVSAKIRLRAELGPIFRQQVRDLMMLSVKEAHARIYERTRPLAAQSLPLGAAVLGLALAEDVV